MATKFDRETFDLLKMTDSGSDSVHDLDHTFEVSQKSRNKKKVRLKRRERKSRRVITKMGTLNEAWWFSSSICPRPPVLLPSSSQLVAFAAAIAVIAIVSIGFFTSNLHYKIQILEDQLRSKIVDDDAKSVPESLEQIGTRLRALESNQTNISGHLARISSSITDIMSRLDNVDSTLAQGGEKPVRLSQEVAEIREGVGEVTKQLEMVSNRSMGNSRSIEMINKELNTLKLNEIDLKNGKEVGSPQKSKHLDGFETKVDLLASRVDMQTVQVDSLNKSMSDFERNVSSQLDIEHKDIVSLAGKVASLQDDNLNVSSSLASLSTRCSSEIIALLTNVTELHKKMEGVQTKLEGEGHSENFVQNKQAVITKEESDKSAGHLDIGDKEEGLHG